MSFILDPAIIAADFAKGGYDASERALIDTELERIYADITAGKPKGSNTFYITAGGPGAGKTTFIRHTQDNPASALSRAVHADPDELIKSFRPYTEQIAREGDSDDARAAAYDRWRWASVYLCNTIVNKLAADGYDIVLGTTGTSASVKFIYQAAHNAGYQSQLIICHASEDTRIESTQKRFVEERRFIPIEDVKKKGNEMFPAVVDVHLAHAQNIAILWRQGRDSAPVVAATLDQQSMTVKNQPALTAFAAEIKKYNPAFDLDASLQMRKAALAPVAAPVPAAPSTSRSLNAV